MSFSPCSNLGLAGRFRPFLLDLFNFVDQVVGHFDQLFPCALARHRVGFAPVEQVQVRHRIVVIRLDRDGMIERF